MAAMSKNAAIIAKMRNLSEVPVPWCDEYERMISGMIFQSSNDPAMQAHRVSTLKLIRQFNDDSVPEDATIEGLKFRRMNVARKLFGKLGADVNIETPLFCGWGCNTFIGDRVYINRDVSIFDNASVYIGARTLIGPSVIICTGTHDVSSQVRADTKGSFAKPIVIEEDCWIGARATLLPGVRIGKGSVVAAGAVVVREIEAGVVVGGVPARVLSKVNENRNGAGM